MRKLTPFLAQEMLYDYAIGRLDDDRKEAVEAFIKTDQESQRILAAIKKNLEYATALGRIQLKPEILADIRESENAISLGKKYSSWREWPETLRWSVTAIILSGFVAMLVAVIPWNRIPSLRPAKKTDTIEIAEIPRVTDKQQLEALNEHQETGSGDEGSGDEEGDETPASPADLAKAKALAQAQADGSGDDESVEAPAPVAAAKAPKPTATPTPTKVAVAAPAPAATPAFSEDAPVPKSETKPKGFVSRAFMTLSNLDEVGPKISDNVTELGGEKAGEVELGWKRGSGRYYHFAMPEENEEKLLEKLRNYGPVRISKDPHPRVMPKGQVRIILWVESAR